MTVTLTVDGKALQAAAGNNLLEVCLDNGITVPNLCHLSGLEPPPAACRLCFVELEGTEAPVTSCTVPVSDGMVVHTNTDRVRRLQQSALRFLLSVHNVDCKNCHANRNCALQDLARFLKVGLKSRGLSTVLKEPDIDDNHPVIRHYPNRCVLCERCLRTCHDRHGHSPLALSGRGFDTVIRCFAEAPEDAQRCRSCTGCVDVCPVGALVLKAG
jgi:NADH dehydrogenase/NADH:ubiquinone oxidoreductase subunit G